MTVQRGPAQLTERNAARSVLIVNADDFGQTFGINRGVAQAHEHGIVTSASLMVRWPASAAAALYARQHPELSLGLHVDLGEWAYRDGGWSRTYAVVSEDSMAVVAEEVTRQYARFRHLVDREPTHLDSHQHVHREEPARTILRELAGRLGVPLREFSRRVHYSGDFYGQTAEGDAYPEGITLDNLLRIVTELQPGVTELGCHPGLSDDLPAAYGSERATEVRVLCDNRVLAALDARGVELLNFGATVASGQAGFRAACRRKSA